MKKIILSSLIAFNLFAGTSMACGCGDGGILIDSQVIYDVVYNDEYDEYWAVTDDFFLVVYEGEKADDLINIMKHSLIDKKAHIDYTPNEVIDWSIEGN